MPLIMGGGVVVVVIAIVLATGKGPPPPPPVAEKPPPDIGWNHERVQQAVKWANSVHGGDRIELAITTDLDAFQRRFALGDSRMVSTLSGDDRTKLKDQIIEALLTHEETKILREFEPYMGRLADVSMAASGEGKVRLDVQARESVRDQYVSEGTLEVTFATRDGKFVINGFSIASAPARKPEKVVKAPKPKHDTIEKPKGRMVERDGQKFAIFEADLVPLDHLADTPPDLRTEIDNQVSQLVNLGLRPRERTAARNRLKEIGKPAVPRLLTRFNDIKADSADGIAQLTQIDALLKDMTGRAFAFSPATQTTLTSAKENEEARISALKQWYGWWYYFHDKPLDWAIDKEDKEEDFSVKRLPTSRPSQPVKKN